MIVTRLKLANLRVLDVAEFRFQPGFNLIVGVNGVGKSTVLDALRICISRIFSSTTESRAKAISFAISDIRNGCPFLDAELSLTIGVDEFRFTRRQWREAFAEDDVKNLEKLRREILNSERLPDRARNLLRELEESHLQHCDTRKGDRDLEWNPADPAHHIETRVRYELDGSIHADDADFDDQLNDVLNLNLPVLKNNRQGIYDAVLRWWGSQKKRNHGRVPRERLERERGRHGAGVGELTPYAQVAVWLLGQKLAGMAA